MTTDTVLALPGLEDLWAPWVSSPPQTRVYQPNVERWRPDAAKLMPQVLRTRPDATLLVDKMLHVIDGESGGNPYVPHGDGGIAVGLFQSHYLPRDGSATPEDMIADAWRLVLDNPDQWTHWGEGVLYQGKPFGALGNYPYQAGHIDEQKAQRGLGAAGLQGAALGAAAGNALVDRQAVFRDVVRKRLGSEEAAQAVLDELSRSRAEAANGEPGPALTHEEQARTSHGPDPSTAYTDQFGRVAMGGEGVDPNATGLTGDPKEAIRQAQVARLKRFSEGLGGGVAEGIVEPVLAAHETARQATRIPYVSDFLEEQVVPRVGAAINQSSVGYVPNLVSQALGGPDIGQTAARAVIPTTGLDVAELAGPGLIGRGAPAIARAAGESRLGQAAIRSELGQAVAERVYRPSPETFIPGRAEYLGGAAVDTGTRAPAPPPETAQLRRTTETGLRQRVEAAPVGGAGLTPEQEQAAAAARGLPTPSTRAEVTATEPVAAPSAAPMSKAPPLRLTEGQKLVQSSQTGPATVPPAEVKTIADELPKKPRPKRSDPYYNAPPAVTDEASAAKLSQTIDDMAKEGAPTRFWYEISGSHIQATFPGDVESQDKFARILAYSSMQTPVKNQGTSALKAWSQYLSGQDIAIHTEDMNAVLNKAMRMTPEEWDAEITKRLNSSYPKAANFYLDMLDTIDPERAAKFWDKGRQVTVDQWMARAYGYDKDALTPGQYRYISQDVMRTAEKYGWTPKQAQAAIWAVKKAQDQGGSVAERGYTFADALKRHEAGITWESAPRRGTERSKLLPDYESWSWAEKVEHHRDVMRALQDDDGADIIAKAFRAPFGGMTEQVGAYGTKVNPGAVTRFYIGPEARVKTGITDPAQAAMLSSMSKAYALALQQEAVPWTKPYYETNVGHHNGVRFNIGRGITPAESQAIIAELGDGFYPYVMEGYGFSIVRVPELREGGLDLEGRKLPAAHPKAQELAQANYVARKRILDVVREIDFDGVDHEVTPETFSTDAGYDPNDWTVEPYGEALTRNDSALQRPHVREAILAVHRRVLAADQAALARSGGALNTDTTQDPRFDYSKLQRVTAVNARQEGLTRANGRGWVDPQGNIWAVKAPEHADTLLAGRDAHVSNEANGYEKNAAMTDAMADGWSRVTVTAREYDQTGARDMTIEGRDQDAVRQAGQKMLSHISDDNKAKTNLVISASHGSYWTGPAGDWAEQGMPLTMTTGTGSTGGGFLAETVPSGLMGETTTAGPTSTTTTGWTVNGEPLGQGRRTPEQLHEMRQKQLEAGDAANRVEAAPPATKGSVTKALADAGQLPQLTDVSAQQALASTTTNAPPETTTTAARKKLTGKQLEADWQAHVAAGHVTPQIARNLTKKGLSFEDFNIASNALAPTVAPWEQAPTNPNVTTVTAKSLDALKAQLRKDLHIDESTATSMEDMQAALQAAQDKLRNTTTGPTGTTGTGLPIRRPKDFQELLRRVTQERIGGAAEPTDEEINQFWLNQKVEGILQLGGQGGQMGVSEASWVAGPRPAAGASLNTQRLNRGLQAQGFQGAGAATDVTGGLLPGPLFESPATSGAPGLTPEAQATQALRDARGAAATQARLAAFQQSLAGATPEEVAALRAQRLAPSTGKMTYPANWTIDDINRYRLLEQGIAGNPTPVTSGGGIIQPPTSKEGMFPGFEPESRHWNLLEEALGVLGAPQSLMTTLDLGAIMRQGQRLGWSHRRIWAEVTKHGAWAEFSEEHAQLMQKAIETSDFYQNGVDHGLKFFERGAMAEERAPGFVGLNKSNVSRALEANPVLRAAERGHVTLLNLEAMKVYEAYASWAAKNISDPKLLDEYLNDYAHIINVSRGIGSLNPGSQLLGPVNAFFSAKNMVSMFEQPVLLFTKAGPLPGQAGFSMSPRGLAAKSLGGLFASNTLLLGFLGLTGTMAGGLWGTDFNPLSSNFGKIRIGNTRFDTLAGFGPIVRLLARAGAEGMDQVFGTDLSRPNENVGQAVVSFFRNKASPVVSTVINTLSGSDAVGQPYKLLSPSTLTGLLVPVIVQTAVEAFGSNQGSIPKRAGVTALATAGEAVGVGANTYESQEDLRQRYTQQLRLGDDYAKLNYAQQRQVREAIDKAGLGPPRSDFSKAADTAKAVFDQRLSGAENAWKQGDLNQRLPDAWHDISMQRLGSGEVQRAFYNDMDLEPTSELAGRMDKLLKLYNDFRVEDSNGQLDFAATKTKQQAFIAQLPKGKLADGSPADGELLQSYLDFNESRKSPLQQKYDQYRQAREKAGYQAIDPGESDQVKSDKRKANEALYKNHPELDAQQWYFESGQKGGGGGELATKKAVDSVLETIDKEGLKNREVHFANASRNLNDPKMRELWKTEGGRIDRLYATDDYVKANGDSYADKRYDKKFAQLTPAQQQSIASSIRQDVVEGNPSLDALHAYLGIGGSSATKYFLLHSKAAVPELDRLKAKYGNTMPREGWKYALAADAR